jgi:hypothetical protein
MSINFALALGLLNMSSMRAGRVLLVLYALHPGARPLTVGLVGPVIFGFIGSAFGLPPVFWVNGLMLGMGAHSATGASPLAQPGRFSV